MENMNLGGDGGQIEFFPPANNQNPSGNTYQTSEENNSALHFFLYLITFFALQSLATGLGTILYQIIDKFFPDANSGYSSYDGFTQMAIKFGLASIIIAAPIYFILSFLITRYLSAGKIKENSKVRKWVTYIILFIAAAIILGDLILLVYNFLGGEMAAQFFLKALVILLIAGSILGYYFWDMRKKNMVGMKYAGNKIAASVAITIIAVVFVGSFFIMDSPALTRDKNIDGQTISRMKSYVSYIDSYYQKYNMLPNSLSDLSGDLSNYSYQNTTGINVVYDKTGDYAYQLCADFRNSNLQDPASEGDINFNAEGGSSSWAHDKGNKCFSETISQGMRSVVNYNNGNASQVAMQPTIMPTQPTVQAASPNDNSQLLKAVTDAVNVYTATQHGTWENKVSITAFDSTKTAAKGKWWAADAWDWVAWQQSDGTWKVFAFGDGFKCGTDSIIPAKYNDFFHDVFYHSLSSVGEEKIHCF